MKLYSDAGLTFGVFIEVQEYRAPHRRKTLAARQIESIGDGADGRCYIVMKSSQVHCVKESYEELKKLLVMEDENGSESESEECSKSQQTIGVSEKEYCDAPNT